MPCLVIAEFLSRTGASANYRTANKNRQWYAHYGQTRAARNERRMNKSVLFQPLAWEASFVRTCYKDTAAKILDIGGGSGSSLDMFGSAIARSGSRVSTSRLIVCTPGVTSFWLRIRKLRNPSYGVLARRDVRQVFHLESDTDLVTVEHGALLPPLGRALSTDLPCAYFLIGAVVPFCVGQVSYLLRERA